MKTETSGILILSHQGYSFLEDMVTAARSQGLQVHVLMSQPAAAAASRIETIEVLVDALMVSDSRSLTMSDVSKALRRLKAKGKQTLAVVSVWEGYRLLMARANAHLGAGDQDVKSLASTLDKHRMRRRLGRVGLSKVRSQLVGRTSLAALLKSSRDVFLKPRRGLASFGAFRLTPSLTLDAFEKLKREMAQDPEYQDIFGSGLEFVAEDFIPGQECSFEVVALRGRLHMLAIHEKLEVEQDGCTVLENLCVSPPLYLTPAQTTRGEAFIETCFHALGLTNGCYHVEAKYDPSTERWEIIEINPRVGGALIKESVRLSTEGADLLALWIETLVATNPDREKSLAGSLSRFEKKRGSHTTLFRVYFGKPGRRIRSIRQKSVGPKPTVFKVHVKAGDALPESSREIFLGQALWRIGKTKHRCHIEALKTSSRKALEVKYERSR